jgi:hypothetical protein
MKTLLLAVLGVSLVIVSCAGSKSGTAPQYDQLANCSELEDSAEPLKRHDKW